MGADVIVTVRMPASLLEALRAKMGDDHYGDLSEQVRSITRKGCLRYAQLLREQQGGGEAGRRETEAAERKERPTELPTGRRPSRDAQVEALLLGLRELLRGEGR